VPSMVAVIEEAVGWLKPVPEKVVGPASSRAIEKPASPPATRESSLMVSSIIAILRCRINRLPAGLCITDAHAHYCSACKRSQASVSTYRRRNAVLTKPATSKQHQHCAVTGKVSRLNPEENVWQYMRDNWISNRVFGSAAALVDHCCDAWNRLES